jgi:IrrE N-terminal-like domain
MIRSNYSELLQRFARKLGSRSAKSAMRSCARSLINALPCDGEPFDVQSAMRKRGIRDFSFEKELECDGYIEPLGSSFESGFRVAIKPFASAARQRFTIAHEICHTFFYEFVPELKYQPRAADSGEERLCNLGAAELLVPRELLLREEDAKYPSLSSLERLAARYRVSLEVMLVRLSSLRLWSCSVLHWYRLSNGDFSLDKAYGASFREWKVWIIDEMLSAWETPGAKKVGNSYLSVVDERGFWGSDSIHYEIKRRADHVIMLWSKTPFVQNPEDAPLFLRSPSTLSLFDPTSSATKDPVTECVYVSS